MGSANHECWPMRGACHQVARRSAAALRGRKKETWDIVGIEDRLHVSTSWILSLPRGADPNTIRFVTCWGFNWISAHCPGYWFALFSWSTKPKLTPTSSRSRQPWQMRQLPYLTYITKMSLLTTTPTTYTALFRFSHIDSSVKILERK